MIYNFEVGQRSPLEQHTNTTLQSHLGIEDHCHGALGSGQHLGFNKFNILPNDSALHNRSRCQHTQIRNMITERRNVACRMNLKAISKTCSLGSCTVSKDIGSNERMTMPNLQIPETADSIIVPKWLFSPRFPDKRQIYLKPSKFRAGYSHRCKNTNTTN